VSPTVLKCRTCVYWGPCLLTTEERDQLPEGHPAHQTYMGCRNSRSKYHRHVRFAGDCCNMWRRKREAVST